MQDCQSALLENDVGCIFSHIHGLGHRDADVGRMQRWGIVDAVAEKAHHVAPALEGDNDTMLLRRRHPCEHGGAFGHGGEGRISHGLELLAQDHTTAIESHLGTDVLRHNVPKRGCRSGRDH